MNNQEFNQQSMDPNYNHDPMHASKDALAEEMQHPATSHHGMPFTPNDEPPGYTPPQHGQQHEGTTLTEKLEAKAQQFQEKAAQKAGQMTQDATETFQNVKERMQEQHCERKDPYTVAVDEAVVEKIAARCVRNINGIVALKGGPLCAIQENLGACPAPKGTRAEICGNEVCIEVAVILKYGTPAKDVFEAVKKDVIPEVENLTGLKVKELTVRIASVMDDEEIARWKSKPTAMETAGHVASTMGSALSSAAGTVVSTVKVARSEAMKTKGRNR